MGFTQYLNTPFSGLAADGGKMALWNLLVAGYRCVAFIHDEIVIELPEDCNFDEHTHNIQEIMCEAMQELTGSIPIKSEFTVSTVWSKEAQLLRTPDGQLRIWSPSSSQ